MNNPPKIYNDQSEAWKDGYDTGKEENLEDVSFVVGLWVGLAIGLLFVEWLL